MGPSISKGMPKRDGLQKSAQIHSWEGVNMQNYYCGQSILYFFFCSLAIMEDNMELTYFSGFVNRAPNNIAELKFLVMHIKSIQRC